MSSLITADAGATGVGISGMLVFLMTFGIGISVDIRLSN
jgi:hypothetical protein